MSNMHKRIAKFIESTKQEFSSSNVSCAFKTTSNGNDTKIGLYLMAFCNGLDQVLNQYTQKIKILEQELLKNPQLGLAYILADLNEFPLLFKNLISMVDRIKEENIHGCLLIGAIDMFFYSGLTSVAQASNWYVILYSAHSNKNLLIPLYVLSLVSFYSVTEAVNIIFYRHICDWLFYGRINDTYNEFFICDGQCADNYFYSVDQTAESSTNTSGFNLAVFINS